jgi:glycine/D-amino acid oxidase-like deaminating enzyme
VKFAFNSNVTAVEADTLKERFLSATIEHIGSNGAPYKIPCHSIVIAAGPWSGRVFDRLFPGAKVKIPMKPMAAAGHHLLVKTPRWKPFENEQVTQVFLNNVVPGGNRLDITSFVDGTLYIGGWGAIPEPVPELADSVRPQPTEIKAMIDVAKLHLNLRPDEDLEIIYAGRCYRPRAHPNKPIIAKVEWDSLGYSGSLATFPSKKLPMAGLYINTAHHSDGVTLGPGSGKVMSELLMGRETSVDISGLGLSTEGKPVAARLEHHFHTSQETLYGLGSATAKSVVPFQ